MTGSVADSVQFSTLCDMLLKLKSAHRTQKRAVFNSFVRTWNEEWTRRHPGKVSEAARKDSFFPVLRLILANEDSRSFNMKRAKLIQYVVKALMMPTSAADEFANMGTERCIDRLADEVSKRKGATKCDLSIAAINRLLDDMKSSSDDKLKSDFDKVVRECSKQELTIVFHVLVRNIESFLGIRSMFVLQWIHPDANPMLLRGATLEKMCEAFVGVAPTEKSSVFNASDVLGKPFRPMLLKQLPFNASAYEEIVKHCDGDFYTELKYDGEHILLHKLPNGEYRYFTRNQVDYSERFGETKDQKFSYLLDPFFRPTVQNCILDGELLLWDTKRDDFVRKGRKASDGKYYDAKHLDEDATFGRSSDVRRCIAVFDLLFYNGKNLMNVPLEERLRILEQRILSRQDKTIIFISGRTLVSSKEQLREIYSSAMDKGEEGIVIKGLKSVYNIGSRAFKNGWFKMKPDYGTHATMDLAIVAVRKDKSSGFIESFMLAAMDGSKYRVVSPVNTNMKRHEFRPMLEKLQANGGYLEGREVPEWLTGIFPYREDSKYQMCFVRKPNIQDAEEAEKYTDYLGFSRRIRNESLNAVSGPKTTRKRLRGVDERFVMPKKLASNPSFGDGLKGKNVCVLQADNTEQLKHFQQILFSFSAQVKPNPVSSVDFLIATKATHIKTQTQIKVDKKTIVHGRWLLNCESKQKILPWKDDDIIHESPLCSFSLRGNGDGEEDETDGPEEEEMEDTPPPSDAEMEDTPPPSDGELMLDDCDDRDVTPPPEDD
uniref:DNA ligase IV n=1 Tax=Steinernema glaseri TaxID=37863 RepID=A0A1I7ZHF5_9BILA